jgi:hypothetical protein
MVVIIIQIISRKEIIMCELCESLKTGEKVNGRCLVKLDEYTYELQLWESKPTSEFDYIYELFATTEIKWCPECGNLLGDIPLEELNFSNDTYSKLHFKGIRFLSDLKRMKYEHLMNSRIISNSNIIEIQETLKRY